MIRLRELEPCFRGLIPTAIATVSEDGVPNVTVLSILHYVDDTHVAVSFQFLNKTRENILANPRANLLLTHPLTLEQYRLDVTYERTDTEGRTFDAIRTNLAAVASQTGMAGVFTLRGADVYRVHAIEKLAHDVAATMPEPSGDIVAAIETLSTRMAACEELDKLLDTTLRGLAELFGLPHAMILFADDASPRLYTVASHGFEASGVGGEVAIGEGLIGMAALERRPVRIGSMHRARLLATAIRASAAEEGQPIHEREIPLPGLPDVQSQLAVPIVVRDRLLGVLCVQSPEAGRMRVEDEQALSTLARYLATQIALFGTRAAADEPSRVEPTGAATAPPTTAAPSAHSAPAAADAAPLRIRYHAHDDSVFIADEYVIKGLPGKILFRLLSTIAREGRVEFTNKELRADANLALGGYRDNLEARLILLRQRLEERAPALALVKTGRGRFRLELARPFVLAED